jgi:hypothetical protein
MKGTSMGIMRAILQPLAQASAVTTKRKVAAFMRAHQRTRQVQEALLAHLIDRHKETAFGRDHGLGSVSNYKEFARAVPIGDYETLRPYMDRVLNGETTALLPADESVRMFSLTSGTTGQPKHIPVTNEFAANMRRTFSIFGYRVIYDHKAVWLRQILTISSPMQESLSPTGLPCGAIGGLLQAEQISIVRHMYTVSPAVTAIENPLAKYYTIMRCSVGRDVSFITTANPSATIKLIETGQQYAEQLVRDVADGTFTPPGPVDDSTRNSLRFRPNRRLAKQMSDGLTRDGVLLPRHFWNVTFLANWTGGTLELYLPRLRELFDNIPIRDIGLVASEGRFSIPLTDETAAGVAEITGNFMEFIPADQHGLENPETLLADELDVGAEYFLVITNAAGLFRYNLDDRIRVTDKIGQSPVIEFLCRGRNTASITGEKLTEHQVVEAMTTACAAANLPIERFVVQGHFAEMPFYELRAEEDLDHLSALAAALDRALVAINVEYAGKRKSGRLGAIRPIPLAPGTLERAERDLIQKRHGRQEQYKHQYLLTDVLTDSVV